MIVPGASALLLALSYPPLHPLVIPFAGLVPFAVWVARRSDDDRGRAASTRGGALLGAIYVTVLCWWVLASLLRTTRLAVPVFLAGVTLVALVAALFGRVLHHAVRGVRAPLWLALPVTWTGFEWTLAHLPGGLAFPWLGLGTSLTGFPELVGIAELVGARGVTFWIALVNGLLAAALLAGFGRARRSRYLAAAVVVLLVPMAWGAWRARTIEVRSAGSVAVVQTDVPGAVRLRDPSAARDSAHAALERLLPTIATGSVGLVVLPEVALPVEPDRAAAAADMDRLRQHARELDAPILFGAWGRDPDADDGSEGVRYNSAFVMGVGGLDDFRYDKHRLVPLVEHTPLVTSSLLSFPLGTGSYGVGQGRPLAVVDRNSFAVLICFESAFEADARAARNAGADVLVNITSDAWFGTEPSEARTTVLWQHPAHMVMRAIENRAGVARASNRGISLFVDPLGHVHDATRPFEEAVRVAEVTTTDVTTVYARMGDVTGNACAVVAFLLLLSSFRRGVSASGRGTGRPEGG